ncbi:ribosome biogenesis protein UTP30 protein [Dioscorea alata]|uniref:Ribosome biogenesis protein UTP30 protein n=1 Tax=Dioscorea alata TaxID=55571 RepID=A0ACB7W5D7_DIOAL|nr:ribosome biogenesis protein UTP30 protein [Dioscorea alata]
MASTDAQLAPPASRVSREAAGRAVDALLKWMRSQAKQRKAQLLEHDDLLYLVLTLKKIPPKGRINAYRIPLPHHLYDLSSTSACLIVDDRPKSPLSAAAALDVVRSLALPVSEVIPLSKLRSDYHPYEARRRLCDSYDLFFADRRVIPLLPRLIGKHFFKKKKIPLPLELSRKSWPEQLRQCLGSTLLYLRSGTCSGLKVGRVSQDRDQIVDNVLAAIDGAVQLVPKKWSNVRSLHLKSVESVALPIYQTLPELGLKIEPLQKERKQEQNDDDAADEVVVQTPKLSQSSKKKTKRRGRIHEGLLPDSDGMLEQGDDKKVGLDDDTAVEGSERLIKKKRKKELKVGKEKAGKKDGLPLMMDGDSAAEDELKDRSKVKSLNGKKVKKVKRSKVRT